MINLVEKLNSALQNFREEYGDPTEAFVSDELARSCQNLWATPNSFSLPLRQASSDANTPRGVRESLAQMGKYALTLYKRRRFGRDKSITYNMDPSQTMSEFVQGIA